LRAAEHLDVDGSSATKSSANGAMTTAESPVIGVTTRRMDTGALHLDVVERAYGDAISRSGGTAHLLPRPASPGAGTLTGLNGLLLSGGGDVDPRNYGQVPSAEVGGIDSARDEWEMALVREALRVGMPVLGICRGCQVLNVACGGTLIQHLPTRSPLPHLVLARESVAHAIQIERRTRLFAAEGTTQIGTNSVHHQAVDGIGEGLRATAWAEDGTVEAIEHLTCPAIGVQWHPENLLDQEPHVAVFAWLVEQAAQWSPGPHGCDRSPDA
jgi:putative glutamine amidotransferase